MKASANITSQKIICLVSLCLFMFGGAFQASAATITFDDVVAGQYGTAITEYYYPDHGVKFHGLGLGPDMDAPTPDYNAYAYSDDAALSGSNVIGVRIPPPGSATYLNFEMGYGVARFWDEPTGYVGIYGVGDDFIVRAYNRLISINDLGEPYLEYKSETDGVYLGDHPTATYPNWHPLAGDPMPVYLIEIDRSTQMDIRSVTFGAYTGGYYTWFDNFTYGGPETVPLPTSVVLLGLGLVSLVAFRRKSGE